MKRRALTLAAASLAWAGLSHAANATTWTVDCSSAANSTISNGVSTVASGLTPSNALGSLLGTPLGPGAVTPGPVPNDTILINALCTQDVTIRTSGLTLANPAGATATLDASDGVVGQLELAGAANTVIDGLSLGPTTTAGGEVANLYVHDGSALALKESQVVNSPLIGIDVARSSSAALTDTAVTGSTGTGILAQNNSTLLLGNDSGTKPAIIENNAGSGVVADDASSLVIDAATISGNQLTQVTVLGASSAFMTGMTNTPGSTPPTTTIIAPGNNSGTPNTAPLQAIFASGSSTLDIEQGVVVTGNQTNSAIMIEGSSLLLNASLISSGAGASAPTKSQATITATANAVIALASGNSICFGTLTVATPPQCTLLDKGLAVILNHVATFTQVGGPIFGFPLAPDTVTGGGGAQLQSTMDLGLGIIAPSMPTLNWVTGSKGVSLSQNSSFRLEGGVNITGAVLLGQASNAFFNLANNAGNTTPNTISGGVTCGFTSIPASHVSISGNSLTPPPSLAPTMASAMASAALACLAF